MVLVAVMMLPMMSFAAALNGGVPDNQLSQEEKRNGWLLLFDGKTTSGWQTSDDKPGKTPV